jgi:predicted DNA-binding protein with PD1-like motif
MSLSIPTFYRLLSGHWQIPAILAIIVLVVVVSSAQADLKYWGDTKIADVYRLRLDPGDDLLERVEALIAKEKIVDGAVIAGIGTLSECRMHWITTTSFPSEIETKTIKEPLEVMAIHGIIADSEPHLHMSISSRTRALGGHVHEGCKVLYLAELVLVKFDGPALARRPNEHGTSMLENK